MNLVLWLVLIVTLLVWILLEWRHAYPNFILDASSARHDMKFKVDLVVTWVDGSRPDWVEQYNTTREREVGDRVMKKERFTNDEPNLDIQTCLESARKFAPWLNRIFLITHRPQVPENVDLTGVKVVHHDEFIPKERLPLFNSHAIEAHLHLIPGLAEHFIYTNDDMYFGQPVARYHFFDSDQSPTVDFTTWPVKLYRLFTDQGGCVSAHYNLSNLVSKNSTFFTFVHTHTMYPLTKTLMSKAASKWPSVWERTAASRFRDIGIQIPPVSLAICHGARTGKVKRRHADSDYRAILFFSDKHVGQTAHTLGVNNDRVDLTRHVLENVVRGTSEMVVTVPRSTTTTRSVQPT